MKLSRLVEILETLKAEHGDLEVKVQTLSHIWDPEPTIKYVVVKSSTREEVYILLNP